MCYKSYGYGDSCNLARRTFEFIIFLHAMSSHIFSVLLSSLILFLSMSLCLLDLPLTFTTKLPISVDLFLSKAGPRHLMEIIALSVLICKGHGSCPDWPYPLSGYIAREKDRETDTDFHKDRQ